MMLFVAISCLSVGACFGFLLCAVIVSGRERETS